MTLTVCGRRETRRAANGQTRYFGSKAEGQYGEELELEIGALERQELRSLLIIKSMLRFLPFYTLWFVQPLALGAPCSTDFSWNVTPHKLGLETKSQVPVKIMSSVQLCAVLV